MTWQELIAWGSSELERHDVEDAELNAEYLALHAAGLWHRSDLRQILKDAPSDDAKFRALIARRARREPLQYIVGEWEFFGLRFHVTPAALIPRPETEILVEEALKEAKRFTRPKVLDIGTGTGAIALAIASRIKEGDVIGIDISREALDLAEVNRQQLGIENVRFIQLDVLQGSLADFENSLDILVSNPPYVSRDEYNTLEPELAFEPRVAITDEANGLVFYERIIELSRTLLKPGAVLLLEMGYDVQEAVARLATSAGLSIDRIVPDLSGIERVLVARKPV